MALLFLVGPRGSGKSTVARLIAQRLGWNWIDADELLEERAGKTIREIFAVEGERGFRERESMVLREVCTLRDHVVATGGGVVLRPENRDLLKSGTVVYLTADAETLWQRMVADASTAERRPALAGGGMNEVEQILLARDGVYRECAQIIVETRAKTPETVADEIIDDLRYSDGFR